MGKMYLILANGTIFEGQSFGYETETTGELVFNTGMVGYLETLSDPAYYGQIVVQTFPLIGNYGVIESDMDSGFISPKGYIVREWCQEPSNFRSEGSLDIFLKEKGVPGICNLDTRALTRILREEGSMNAKFSLKPELSEEEWNELKSYSVSGGVEATSIKTPTVVDCKNGKYNVVLIDYGSATGLVKELTAASCSVTILPWSATASDVSSLNPHGVVLSDGPGNPAEYLSIVKTLKDLSALNIPTLALGLGHQLLALSYGATTSKMHHGHRGSNHPILNKTTGLVSPHPQNHGYVVEPDSLPPAAVVNYINCNDGTCEGIIYPENYALSIQYQLSSYNAADSAHPINKFICMMEKVK